MVVAILLLLIFSAVLLCVNYKSRYTWLFMLIALSLDCLLIAMILFHGKLLSYRGIWHIDQKVYTWLNSCKVGFYEIVNLVNVGVFLYMVSMCGFINYLRPKTGKFRRGAAAAASLLPAVGFLILNSSQVCRKMHTWLYIIKPFQWSGIAFGLWEVMRWINYIVIIAYVIYPILCAFAEYRNTGILYNKRKMLVMTVILSFMDIFYVYMLYHATFGFALLDLKNLLKFQSVYQSYATILYTVIPFTVLVLFQGSIFLFVRFRVLERVDFFRRITISKKNKLLFEDIRPILHSYKNVLISLNFLGKSIVENYGSKEALEDAKEIIGMTDESCDAMSNLLNVFNDSHINVDEVELYSCIKEALRIAVVDTNIDVNIDYTGNSVVVLGDRNHLTRMFENMFFNSVEAMEDTENPRIDISITCEYDWNCISIRDNGCGITKKDLKKIFRPLYSTKRTSKSWGIGLSYVYKVLQAHNGLIFVSSTPGKFTEFQVLLPTMKEISIDE